MPITLTTSGTPWVMKVTTLGFNADGQVRRCRPKGLQLAADPEKSVPGWLRIEQQAAICRLRAQQAAQKQPDGKYVWTINLPIYNQDVMGDHVFHICDTSAAYLHFAEQRHNRAEPKLGAGTIPLIRIVDAKPRETSEGRRQTFSSKSKSGSHVPTFSSTLSGDGMRRPLSPTPALQRPSPINHPAMPMPRTGRDPLAIGRRDLDDEIPF